MRTLVVTVGLGCLVLATGCPNWSQVRDKGAPVGNGTPVTRGTPDAAHLVAYLNKNADLVPALACEDLILDGNQDGTHFGTKGKLICQQPKSFFLDGKAVGRQAVLVGSNEREFWYWISEVKPVPYLFHCSYDDYNSGRARNLQVPFQPEWIMDALGMARYDEKANYRVIANGRTVNLEQDVVSPQGQRLRKITVFNAQPAQTQYGKPQVLAHMLVDEKGHEVCAAHITQVQVAPNGAVIPKRVEFDWPSEKVNLKLRLEETQVTGQIPAPRAAALFSRDGLMRNLQGYDLARGEDRGGIQPAGGPIR